jgi:hypothetical protein
VIADLPEAWLERLTRPEARVYEFFRRLWAERATDTNCIAPTYDEIGSVVFRWQIKHALDGLQRLGLIDRSGVVRGARGHPRFAYRVFEITIVNTVAETRTVSPSRAA